eukprot:6192817-Pleurochrysis_carterae.AAC.3
MNLTILGTLPGVTTASDRAGKYLLIHESTSSGGMGASAGAGAGRACGGLRSGRKGDGDVGHALEDWKLKAQRASAPQVHMRCERKDGKCACETQ